MHAIRILQVKYIFQVRPNYLITSRRDLCFQHDAFKMLLRPNVCISQRVFRGRRTSELFYDWLATFCEDREHSSQP